MIAMADELARAHPCLILADADPSFSATVERSFRRLGWDVYVARTGPELRRLVRMLNPSLVVLGTELPLESGWLTCDKLRAELSGVKIALVVEEPTPYLERFAKFVGAAALVGVHSAPAALLELANQPAAA